MPGGFADAVEDDVGNMGFIADAAGVPEEFAFFLRGIAPCGLAFLKAFLHDALGFAEHDRDVFIGVEPIADEKRNHDDVAGLGNLVAISDAGFFFHENGIDFVVFTKGADELDLVFDGFAGVFIIAGAVSRDEKGGFGGFGRAGEGMFLNYFAGPSEENMGHAVVGADGTAIVESLGGERGAGWRGTCLDTGIIGLTRNEKAEFTRDDFFGEITFADEKGDDENTRSEGGAEDRGDGGFLFPECFENGGENAAAAEFIGMLPGWSGGIGVKGRSVAD